MPEHDHECDSMFLYSAKSSLWNAINKEVARHCKAIPSRLRREFAEQLEDIHVHWIDDDVEFSSNQTTPDLYGHEAYDEYFKGRLGG